MAWLYRDVQPDLLRFLATRAWGDAEDVAASTWLHVARGLEGFVGGQSGFRAWVFTIARCQLANHRRRHARRPSVATPGTVLAEVPGTDQPERDVLDALAGDDAARLVASLLPARQAEVVLLRVVGGLGTDEVAHITGRSPGAVRVLLHRALRRLATELGPGA